MNIFLKKNGLGDIIEGVVERHLNFGVGLNVNGYEKIKFLIRIVNFTNIEPMNPLNYPPLGTKIKGVIVGINEIDKEVNLSLKDSDVIKYNLLKGAITVYKAWV